jgi:hypothetical protein
MLAAPKKTLIAALGALAGLAAIAVTPVSALADGGPAQAAQVADARRAAAALITGPDAQDMQSDKRRDVDPAGGRSAEAHPFNATGESEKPAAATVTAGTDNAQRPVLQRAEREVKRTVKRKIKRRIKRKTKSRRRARRLARRRY